MSTSVGTWRKGTFVPAFTQGDLAQAVPFVREPIHIVQEPASGRLGLAQFYIKGVEQRFRIQFEQRGVVAHKPACVHRSGKDRPVTTFQCLNLIRLHFRLIHHLRNGESL